MPSIGYLVHDLADPAVARRAAMLESGGACVRMAGFLRGERQLPAFSAEVGQPIVLGRTRDARLVARALSVGWTRLTARQNVDENFRDVDVLVARNLEMLVIGVAVVRKLAAQRGQAPRLVYECLDIHRLLTGDAMAGRAVQALERRLARSVDLAVTSSPAFVEHHLGDIFGPRTFLAENKVLALDGQVPQPAPPRQPGPPWRIGWFGNLRCRRSLEILAAIARQGAGRLEVLLRGRPSESIFPDLGREVADVPHLTFGGAYEGARELSELYQDVHFAWCLDFYEEGSNSAWLLPNRLYESASHNTLPIALGSVETGAFLRRKMLSRSVV